jgi:hypothetical protein
MGVQPGGEGLRGPVRQQVDRPAAVHVDQRGAVVVAAPSIFTARKAVRRAGRRAGRRLPPSHRVPRERARASPGSSVGDPGQREEPQNPDRGSSTTPAAPKPARTAGIAAGKAPLSRSTCPIIRRNAAIATPAIAYQNPAARTGIAVGSALTVPRIPPSTMLRTDSGKNTGVQATCATPTARTRGLRRAARRRPCRHGRDGPIRQYRRRPGLDGRMWDAAPAHARQGCHRHWLTKRSSAEPGAGQPGSSFGFCAAPTKASLPQQRLTRSVLR